jgi:hypothetical protein
LASPLGAPRPRPYPHIPEPPPRPSRARLEPPAFRPPMIISAFSTQISPDGPRKEREKPFEAPPHAAPSSNHLDQQKTKSPTARC